MLEAVKGPLGGPVSAVLGFFHFLILPLCSMGLISTALGAKLGCSPRIQLRLVERPVPGGHAAKYPGRAVLQSAAAGSAHALARRWRAGVRLLAVAVNGRRLGREILRS